MELFEQMRREYEFGVETISGISRELGVRRRMVREALNSAVPAESKPQQRRLRRLEAASAFIDRIIDKLIETACHLVESFGCRVTGVDHSAFMVETARQKATDRKLEIRFDQADAHHLPFEAGTFDVVISECTTCALDKPRAIGEMIRVTRSGGYVGISDLYWKGDAPQSVKSRLAELEGERPENRSRWIRLFE